MADEVDLFPMFHSVGGAIETDWIRHLRHVEAEVCVQLGEPSGGVSSGLHHFGFLSTRSISSS